ncbi:MAG TPA: tryptophan synthase subunit alpha [Gemmatimonadales bacterium]|nr:tryptophan synthase subunit alpha [Gemmatimonadales bacterium]
MTHDASTQPATRYARMFAALAARGEAAFVPFVVLGDPDPATSLALVDALVAGGADALELGIPFSDPVADGPVIQQASRRALAAGVTPADCLALVARIRARHPDLPIGLLVYANLVVHDDDPARFYAAAARAGADSVLAADVPSVEAAPCAAAARAAGIAPVLIVPPAADRATVRRVAALGAGYTYLLARAGVTGTETAMRPPAEALVALLREEGAPPPLLGFGISTPAHVSAAVAAGAAGAISGSAVVALVERHLGDPAAMQHALADFVRVMKAATRRGADVDETVSAVTVGAVGPR